MATLPFMRPMAKHIVFMITVGFVLGLVYSFAETLAADLFSNKVLVGQKIQPAQAFLLGLDESYVSTSSLEATVESKAAKVADASATQPAPLPSPARRPWNNRPWSLTVRSTKVSQRRNSYPKTCSAARSARPYAIVVSLFVAGGGFAIVLMTVFRYYGAWVWHNVSQYLRVTMIGRLEHLSLQFHSDSSGGRRDLSAAGRRPDRQSTEPGDHRTHHHGLWTPDRPGVRGCFRPAAAIGSCLRSGAHGMADHRVHAQNSPPFRGQRVAHSNLTSRLQETFAALKIVKASHAESLTLQRFDRDSNDALDAALYLRSNDRPFHAGDDDGHGHRPRDGVHPGEMGDRRESNSAGGVGRRVHRVHAMEPWRVSGGKQQDNESLGTGYGFVRLWCMVQDLFIALERAYYFLDLEPDVVDPADPVAYPVPIRSVAWQDVGFSYSRTNRYCGA